ncbi:MAG TPA: septal ring lytic transglycosylase RlpA family protein [Solirubrobacteraceae bacterium]|nr:septal ring lytic transglycosylase RlpA family protein [Solirubrobacteraceae bacterium]
MHRLQGLEAFTRRTRCLLALVPVASALGAIPATALARTAHAGSGGIGVTGGDGAPVTTTSTTTTTSGSSGSGTGQANVVKLSGNVNASGDGITLTVAASGTQGHPLTIAGEAPVTNAGGTIDIETAKPGGTSWTQVATAVIGASGSFAAVWTPSTSAQLAMRAVLAPGLNSTITSGTTGLPGPDSAATAAGVVATSTLTIPIFKNAIATIYGPGLWGHQTACGERLRTTTLGIASRTMKCGTRVSVYFKGREITVPVIDRGPFANHASWDLTMAAAKTLGVKVTSTIGTLAPAPALAAAARS